MNDVKKGFLIKRKEKLNDFVTAMDIVAPQIALKGQAGQFIIFMVDEKGERVPLTIADTNLEEGTVRIIFQILGGTTALLNRKEEGEYISDFVGPLGNPSEVEGYRRAIIVGGGVGSAIAFPVAKKLYNLGAEVEVIAGFRNSEIVILEDEFKKVSNNLYVMTDDGSNGNKGFVTDKLKELLEKDSSDGGYDLVVAIGPLPMMRAVSKMTAEYNVKTIVSMNPIMIDGTGMCGGCRLTVDGKVKFACVDGPEFDGAKVDWDEAMKRGSFYKRQEESCNLLKETGK